MSRRPSDKAIDEAVTELHRLLRNHDLGFDLRKRLKHANRIDRRGGTNRVHDGYPRGSSGPGPTNQVGRPTESSALVDYRVTKLAGGEEGPGRFVNPKDPVRDYFERAWANVEKALGALRIANQQLESVEALGLGVPEPEPCEACAIFDRFTPMETFGDVAGRLEIKMRLCAWHWWQVQRKGKLPTEQQVHGHHDGVVRIDPSVPGAAS